MDRLQKIQAFLDERAYDYESVSKAYEMLQAVVDSCANPDSHWLSGQPRMVIYRGDLIFAMHAAMEAHNG